MQDGGYSSVAERRSVAADVVGSKPTSRPKTPGAIFGEVKTPLELSLPRDQKHSDSRGIDSATPAARRPKNQQPEVQQSQGKTPWSIATELAQAPARLFAGTSGWAYASWKPGFYPDGVAAKKFLPFYASQLNSVEVNYSFRQLPSEAMLAGWLAATPPGFRFSFKAPQRITHFQRLRDCADAVAEFVDRLEPVRSAGKLGLLLFQLPPNFKADAARLGEFLALPALGGANAPAIAFEFRHASWFAEPVAESIYGLLERHNAALCIAGTEEFQTPEIHPASTHTSYRLRRAGGYGPEELGDLARRLVELARTRDVYVYFKHEDEPTGALNGVAFLHEALRLSSGDAMRRRP
jgi:uncharacterized protein YecE (DUF72 family)